MLMESSGMAAAMPIVEGGWVRSALASEARPPSEVWQISGCQTVVVKVLECG